MLRELAIVLDELHDGLTSAAARRLAGVRLSHAEMVLPMDIVPVFQDGGCAVLADVCRSYADAAWGEPSSRLTITWAELPTEALP